MYSLALGKQVFPPVLSALILLLNELATLISILTSPKLDYLKVGTTSIPWPFTKILLTSTILCRDNPWTFHLFSQLLAQGALWISPLLLMFSHQPINSQDSTILKQIRSKQNKPLPSSPSSPPPPPHHWASWKGPVCSLSLLPSLPFTPQPSTIWLPPYHSTETVLIRVTLLELKDWNCADMGLCCGTCILRAWLYITALSFLLRYLFYWPLLNFFWSTSVPT